MKSYSSREVLQILKKDGWYKVGYEGDHLQLKHDTKKGKVTLNRPKKTMPVRDLKSIETQAGIKFD